MIDDKDKIPEADPMAGAIETVEQAAYVRGRGDGYAAAERDICRWLRRGRLYCYSADEVEAGMHRPNRRARSAHRPKEDRP